MADNESTNPVASGKGTAFPDWIELHNAEKEDVDLLGMSITDDPDDPTRHTFSASLVVPAGGFVVLYADGDTKAGPEHLGFSLSRSGEDIALFDAAGQRLDWVTYEEQITDIAAARVSDGSRADGWRYVWAGTPGEANTP